jgi:hypothetical protein
LQLSHWLSGWGDWLTYPNDFRFATSAGFTPVRSLQGSLEGNAGLAATVALGFAQCINHALPVTVNAVFMLWRRNNLLFDVLFIYSMPF